MSGSDMETGRPGQEATVARLRAEIEELSDELAQLRDTLAEDQARLDDMEGWAEAVSELLRGIIDDETLPPRLRCAAEELWQAYTGEEDGEGGGSWS